MLHEEAHQEMSLEGDLAGEGADSPAATSGKLNIHDNPFQDININ